MAQRLTERLTGSARVVDEVHGFRSFDDRDLLGFVDGTENPDGAHLVLNTIVGEDGEERQIMRFNMPFGRVGAGEFGTYFIGYARTPSVIEEMLRNMFIGKPPGTHDRLLDFSTAETGNFFFVPSADFLDDPPTADAGP